MERIASFSVDHLLLEPGVYVSRIDRDPATGAAVTTFDLRLTTPNKEPVMNTAECHTIEHLGATFLRNHAEWSSRIVYFGPMGCRTGFYLVVFGELTSEKVLPLVRELFEFVAGFEGDVPGAAPEECGNYGPEPPHGQLACAPLPRPRPGRYRREASALSAGVRALSSKTRALGAFAYAGRLFVDWSG